MQLQIGMKVNHKRPMKERIKNDAEDILKEVARNRLKALMQIIDTNLIIDKVDKSLHLKEYMSFGYDNK